MVASTGRNKVELTQVVSRDPEVHSGDLVFSGTRVPVETLVAFLITGSSIEEFLESFPTVERWQVESYLALSLEVIDHLLLERLRAA